MPAIPRDAEALIGELVRGESEDEAHLVRAGEVKFRLEQLGVRIFDKLIAHSQDLRISWSSFQGQYDHQVTVGDVCLDIIAGQVEDHDVRELVKGGYLRFIPNGPQGWWTARSKLTLTELKRDALQTFVSEIRNQPNHPRTKELPLIEARLSALGPAN